MELLILRHGEAGKRLPSANKDMERGLTASGREEAESVAKSLDGMEFVLDKIATSPLTRARETAEIVAKVLKKQKDLEVWEELKPEAKTSDLYLRLAKFKEESSILLVGHEPHLGTVISELIAGDKRGRILLKKAGIAKVVIDSLSPRPSGELRWLLTPRQLKRMS